MSLRSRHRLPVYADFLICGTVRSASGDGLIEWNNSVNPEVTASKCFLLWCSGPSTELVPCDRADLDRSFLVR
jgi:hypothetical protein